MSDTPVIAPVRKEPMSLKGLVTFTLFVLPCFALLCWLGVWQIHRLHWKEGLLADINSHVHAAPVSLGQALAEVKAGKDVNYLRVRLHGHLDNDKELYLYGVSNADEGAGWHVVTPFQDDDGTVVLVDRGFVPDRLKDPAKRPQGQLKGDITLVGLLRQPDAPGYFTPANDPEDNRWYWRDLSGMTKAAFPGGTPKLAPFFLEAEKSDIPGGYPEGGQTNLNLPNNHFQYILTWFALAGGLLFVYVQHAWAAIKAHRHPPEGQAGA